jgi:hypothetical protein
VKYPGSKCDAERVGFGAFERCLERLYMGNAVRASEKFQGALERGVDNDLMLSSLIPSFFLK